MRELEDSRYWSYGDLIDSMEYRVVLEVHDNDYQGDSYYLLQRGETEYGILVFGWGSCSGCDALEACDTIDEATELRDDLVTSIKWFDSDEEIIDHLITYDWEGQFFYSSYGEGRNFVGRMKQYFGV